MIAEILSKLHLTFDQLTPEEKKTFQQWQTVLGKPDTTIDDLKELLPKELERAYAELRKHENNQAKDAYYKAYTSLCEFIIKTLTASQQEREQLTLFLKQKYKL